MVKKTGTFKRHGLKLAGCMALLAGLLAAPGCAKNVDKVNFNKWGNSFLPRGTSIDTTAQGGAMQPGNKIPQSTNFKTTKASANGAYFRTFSSSPNYRMVGGFHVTASQ